jgi:tRNA(Arg) A34 adenosine deaminase TadA
VFAGGEGLPVAVGVNSVERTGSPVLHAEVVALLLLPRMPRRHGTPASEVPDLQLYTSCEPCAMCLGAIAWSGVRRVVCGALRADVEAIGFDEGPVFAESYAYLRARGVEFTMGVMRDQAAAVLTTYLRSGGTIYNPVRAVGDPGAR